jgi:hypothetical protein
MARGGRLGLRSGAGVIIAARGTNRPAEPHCYLDVADCAPHAQGRSFGGAVIRAGLAGAYADGVATYAETATKRISASTARSIRGDTLLAGA